MIFTISDLIYDIMYTEQSQGLLIVVHIRSLFCYILIVMYLFVLYFLLYLLFKYIPFVLPHYCL